MYKCKTKDRHKHKPTKIEIAVEARPTVPQVSMIAAGIKCSGRKFHEIIFAAKALKVVVAVLVSVIKANKESDISRYIEGIG